MIRLFARIIVCVALVGAFAWGGEYMFSYKVAVKNAVVINEQYYFSPVMTRDATRVKHPYKHCEIAHEAKSEKELLDSYKTAILECFFSWGVKLEDNSKVNNQRGNSLSHLAIPPTRIKVDYANGIATIYALLDWHSAI